MSRMSPPGRIYQLAASLVLPLLGALCFAACSDADDDPSAGRTCGDGQCSIATCESPVRCPNDCGACSGTDCGAPGSKGSCGEPCSSSCDCVSPDELCTADFGQSPGVCIPSGCFKCSGFDRCQYTPDANKLCANPSCS
jgi:hypothetical protein